MNSRQVGLSIVGTIVKVVIAIIVIMLVYRYAMIAYSYGYQIYNQQPISTGEGKSVSITVTDSDSVSDIGSMLVNKGLIEDARLFTFQERLSEYHGKIQPGTYELSTAMTADQMLQIMSGEEADADEENSGNVQAETNASDASVSGASVFSDDGEMQGDGAGEEETTEDDDSAAMGASQP
ncbi:MAG: endolytic transglycosylase MltG [Butyrivibrio sp.]|jgi:UPF0755 protein|nr:endolytic transglycosylase MltG [Butyrivibrio sp.]